MQPSPYQQAIFDAVASSSDNLMIEAVAGSGKTTTIVEAAKLVPSSKDAIFLAFNKNIASELSVRLPPNVQARTLHSLGYTYCRETIPWFKSNSSKVKNIYFYQLHNFDKLTGKEKQVLGMNVEDLTDYISLLKANCVSTVEQYHRILPEIASHYSLDLPMDDFARDLLKTFLESLTYQKVIDFDDMIYFPAISPKPFSKTYDYIFVDEAQDISPIQSRFLRKLLAPKGRIFFVGDSRQAIYGFRGAGVSSMLELEKEFSCKRLPLSISYRCSQAVVKEAKTICEQIEPSSTAAVGSVTETTDYLSTIQKGDLLLCRTLSPLRKALKTLLENNHPVNFPYPELLATLNTIALKIKEKNGKINRELIQIDCDNAVETYLRFGKDYKAAQCREKYDILSTLIPLFPNETDYNHVFNTCLLNPAGVKVMSIHKAKGLEAANVYFLNAHEIPHKNATQPWEFTQEYNMKYVGITRAKERLVYARDNDNNG